MPDTRTDIALMRAQHTIFTIWLFAHKTGSVFYLNLHKRNRIAGRGRSLRSLSLRSGQSSTCINSMRLFLHNSLISSIVTLVFFKRTVFRFGILEMLDQCHPRLHFWSLCCGPIRVHSLTLPHQPVSLINPVAACDKMLSSTSLLQHPHST